MVNKPKKRGLWTRMIDAVANVTDVLVDIWSLFR